MTERKSDRRGGGAGTSGRPSASSLTDAVVAALAEVEKSKSDVPIPAEARAPLKSDHKKAETKSTDAKSTETRSTEAKSAETSSTGDKKAEGVSADDKKAEGKKEENKREDTVPFERERGDATQKMGGAGEAKPAETFGSDKTLDDAQPAGAAVVPVAATAIVGDAKPSADSVSTDPPPSDAATTVETKAIDGGGDEASGAPATDDKPTQKHPVAVEPAAPKETPKGLAVDYFGRTDVGLVREHNEDNFLVVDLANQKRGIGGSILQTKIEGAGALFAVCDGMGGAAAGEVASQMAVDTIHEMMQNGGVPRDRDHFARRLVRSIEEAGSRIFAAAKMDRSRRGMGTTSTVAGLIDKTLFVGQVGDSRAYVLRQVPGGEDSFALITKDQSLVNQLIEAGQLTEEEAEAFEHSNIILQALGTTEEVTVDLTFLELRRGDRLLMCSDGLSGLVHGDMIKEVVKTSRDLVECANQLIAMANAGGGHDNITVVLADFDGEDLKVATPDEKVAYMQYPLPPEDPKDPDPPPRTPTIKSGGPKPGSDVKHDGSVSAPRASEGGGGNRGLLVGVLIVVLVLVAIAVMLYSGGEAQPASTSRTTTVSHGATTTPRAPTTNLHVMSDIQDATLFVDGVSRGALTGDMHVTVSPGAHHVEARHGDEVVARTDVTATEGTGSMVSLVAPELPVQPTDLEPTSGASGAADGIPSGADMPSDEATPPATGATP